MITKEDRLHGFSENSVQRLYRPVLYEEFVPEEPVAWGDGSPEAVWWQEQYTRCTYGWVASDGHYLNPIYYFYLNFVQIEIKPDGVLSVEPPLYLDTDQEVFDLIYFNQFQRGTENYAKNIVIAKGRRKHWSENTHCGVMLWDFVMGWGNVAIGYPQKDPYLDQGSDRWENAYQRLHDFWKADVLTGTKVKRGYGIKQYNEKTGEENIINRNFIMFSPMDKKFDRFRGQNFWRVLFDEAGVYRNLIQCYGATKDCCREGTFKFGQILIGGTSDAIENKSTDYRDMYFNAPRYDAVTWFIPCYKCSPPDVDWDSGVSLVSLSKPKYEAERAKIKGNSELYHKELQENPMNARECFLPPSKSSYPGTKLEQQAHFILDNYKDHEIIRGRLEWDGHPRERKVIWIPDEAGDWQVYQKGFPTPGLKNLHVMGVDDVYSEDDAPFSDSKCSLVVYREHDHRVQESDLPVAVYLARPSRSRFHNEILKSTCFWDSMVVIENNDGVVVDKMVKKGYGDKVVYINGKPGIKGSEVVWLNKMTGIGDEYFNENRHERIYFLDIITALGAWRQENTDIGSAFHLCLLGVDQRKGIGVEDNRTKVERHHRIKAGQKRASRHGDKEADGVSTRKKWFRKRVAA